MEIAGLVDIRDKKQLFHTKLMKRVSGMLQDFNPTIYVMLKPVVGIRYLGMRAMSKPFQMLR